jgi:hypothetical protein
MKNTKKAYVAPTMTVHGDVEVVTQQVHQILARTDQLFPSGTPFADLTFSN